MLEVEICSISKVVDGWALISHNRATLLYQLVEFMEYFMGAVLPLHCAHGTEVSVEWSAFYSLDI